MNIHYKKHLFYLSIILLVSFLLRFLYLNNFPVILIQADTFGYYLLGQKILSSDFARFIINDERTFIYPVFLNLITALLGHYKVNLVSNTFFELAKYIVYVQSFFAILSLMFLYKGLVLVKIKPVKSLVYTLFICLNYILFAWEKILLTESLAISLLILTFYLFIKLIKKPSKMHFLGIFILFLLNFLLRPIYIALPFVTMPIIILYFQNRKVIIKSVIVLSLFFLFILSYARHNAIHFQYAGISRNSDINLLGKILQFNLPVEAGKNASSYFYHNVLDYRKTAKSSMPFRFLENYDRDIYKKSYLFNELRQFNTKVIIHNFSAFIYKSTLQIPKALMEVSEVITLSKPQSGSLNIFFYQLFILYKNLQFLTFLIIPLYPLTVYQFFKKKNLLNTIILFLGTISIYQIIFAVFLSYGEFGRLICISQPLAYLYLFYWLNKAFQSFVPFNQLLN